MEQYIPKAAVVAEIEKRRNFDKELKLYSRLDECNGILSFINTLEVKDLELTVDDIKNIDRLLNQCVDYSNPYQEVLKRFTNLKK